jgi:hypothetical protein
MPTRLHLPKDWKRRATRALSNLNRPGVAAVCFWCGHRYRRGEYSPETESAHLLQCAEYPQEAKVQLKKRKKAKPNEPEVGIMFLVGNKLIFDSTPLSQAGRYADHLIHEPGHIGCWAELIKSGKVPNRDYEEFPRGRVAYNTTTDTFTLFADKCILDRKVIVRKIWSRLHIPPKKTKTDTDSHYRCYRCLGRNRHRTDHTD